MKKPYIVKIKGWWFSFDGGKHGKSTHAFQDFYDLAVALDTDWQAAVADRAWIIYMTDTRDLDWDKDRDEIFRLAEKEVFE